MRNRLVKHIIESVNNKPKPWEQSDIIRAQAISLKRLSDAYEKLHREHNEMKGNYSRAWGYFKKVHDRARERNSTLPFWESVISEVINYNKKEIQP